MPKRHEISVSDIDTLADICDKISRRLSATSRLMRRTGVNSHVVACGLQAKTSITDADLMTAHFCNSIEKVCSAKN